MWVPVIFFVRGTIADFLRGIAATHGPGAGENPEAFRQNWMLRSRWGRHLVASRFSRGAYAATKCVCFVALGVEWTLFHAHSHLSLTLRDEIRTGVNVLVVATVVFCLVRAVPVYWEGWRDIREMARPAGSTAAAEKSSAAKPIAAKSMAMQTRPIPVAR
jgi:hypothetical protein